MLSIKHLQRLSEHFRDKLGASFIIGFQILLIICTGLMLQGNSLLADELAVYAYYLAVVGVVLHCISILIRGNGGGRESDN